MLNVIMLSQDDILIDGIGKLLSPLGYHIHKSAESDIVLNTYMLDAKFIIADLDFCQLQTREEINSIKDHGFMPALGLYSKKLPDPGDYEIFKYIINKSDISTSLVNIARSFIEFKEHYDNLKECYNTVDNINSKIDDNIRGYSMGLCSNPASIEALLQNAFISNKFLINKPSIIVIYIKHEDGIKANIFKNVNDIKIEKSGQINLERNSTLDLNRSFENAFFSNNDKNQYSDVDNFENMFDKRVIELIGKVYNFTGYATTDIVIMAANYKNRVSSLDAKIIKGLCINLNLVVNLYNKIDEVNEAFIYTMNALARAGEAADDVTGNHIKRVNGYCRFIALSMGLEEDFVHSISYSAQMHDVGKIHISPDIIKKPGKLTTEEFETMKKHTMFGADIIGDSPHLKMAREIALNHHEKFDGTGYPNKLKGNDIPLSARIVALADIYDALRSPRCYKPEFSHEKAYDIISNGDGRVIPEHFDPLILEVFRKYHKDLDTIYEYTK